MLPRSGSNSIYGIDSIRIALGSKTVIKCHPPSDTGCFVLFWQLMVAFFSLSLSMLRDCCLENHEYKISALFINYINVISVFLIAVINIIMTAFGVYPTNVSLDPPIFP